VGHVPHVFVSLPWDAPRLALGPDSSHHLYKVLRRSNGDSISYTDGAGTIGTGTLEDNDVVRGTEQSFPRPMRPIIVVAPPAQKDRLRFMVEKLAELGVVEVRWLRSRFTEGRPPGGDKSAAWSRMALEQSRGAWLMAVPSDSIDVGSLPEGTVFADQSGPSHGSLTAVPAIAIGPEGGWDTDEIPPNAPTIRLSDGVLRVETAAIVAAACSNPAIFS
jgi:RsmE family RNA methyltransferase